MAGGALTGAVQAGRDGGEPMPLRLIVLETTGALFAGRDPIGEVLVPFARERGCVLSVRQIADLYLARAVGGMSAADFWTGLGLAGDPMLLDDVYARRFELADQVLAFLTQANQRGVAVAAVGDDVPEWTAVFRQRFRLDGLIGTWVSSAEVGVRVPHPALLEAVERATGYPPRASMVIGATRSLLDAARRLGYRTTHYNPGPDDPESDHPVLRTFADRGRPAQGTPAA
jgi:putative hydrolase of the HAD superfamily